MDPTSRAERDPRSGAQQTRGQWDSPASGGQGDTDWPTGDAYAQQARYGRAGYGEYGAGAAGLGSGEQRSDELGQSDVGVGTSDPYDTSGQQGGQERFTSDRATRGDPTWQGDRDDDDDTGGIGKPSLGSKVKGTAEKMAGKFTGDAGMQARDQEGTH